MTRTHERTRVVLRLTASGADSAAGRLERLLHDRAERLDRAGAEILTVEPLTRGFPVAP
jgi:hypothetical protein